MVASVKKEAQLDIIRRLYSKDEYNVVPRIDARIFKENLGHLTDPGEFSGKSVLEIGAGCSLFLPIFLEYGCRKLIANDLLAERLALNDINDSRYSAVAGDFLETEFSENGFDLIFAHLTMMFVIPMLDEFFAKACRLLKPGGLLVTIDPNYLCPLSIYRIYADNSGANPATIFNPFNFAKVARQQGFMVEKLVPFTSGFGWTKGNWALGTCFGMRALKPDGATKGLGVEE